MAFSLRVPSGWVRRPFSEAIDFQEGPGILAVDFRPSGVPLIRLSGLEHGKNVLNGCNYLDDAMVEQRWAHFRVAEGDVLLSTSASLGRVAIVDKASVGAIPYTGIIRMRPRMSEVLPSFIPFLLRCRHFQVQVEAMGQGSVIRHFGPTHLRRMDVVLPTLAEQHAIAGILGALDAKIALNRQMNETLEAMSSALFQSWFVDFHPVKVKAAGCTPVGLDAELADLFPSQLVSSSLGPVPSGWRATTVGDEISTYGGTIKTGPFGTALKATEYSTVGVPVISVGEIGHGVFRLHDRTPRVPPTVTTRLSEFVLQEGDIVFGRKGAVDRSARVSQTQAGWFLGSDGLRLRVPGLTDSRFLAHLMRTQAVRTWILQHATGTIMASLNQTLIRSIPIVVPPPGIRSVVSNIVSAFDEKIESNGHRNETLGVIVRTLLPKLLSGELRVPEAETIVGKAL